MTTTEKELERRKQADEARAAQKAAERQYVKDMGKLLGFDWDPNDNDVHAIKNQISAMQKAKEQAARDKAAAGRPFTGAAANY